MHPDPAEPGPRRPGAGASAAGGPLAGAGRLWGFHNPVQLRFGSGVRVELVNRLRGAKFLLVTTPGGWHRATDDRVLSALLAERGLQIETRIESHPQVQHVQELLSQWRGADLDGIVALGGGSAIDSAKAMAICLSPNAPATSVSDLIAEGTVPASLQPVPLYVMPTTAGSGSEMTPSATLWDRDNGMKLSLAGESVYPASAFVDPVLTFGLPEEITVSTGLDAINQAMESLWNRHATPVTSAIATQAICHGFNALLKLADSSHDPASRESMSMASVLAGLAISQTRTGLCHSISYPITSCFHVPHGLACAFTMPAVLRLNCGVDDGRLARLARALCDGDLSDLTRAFERLNERLRVRERVRRYVPSLADLLELSDRMVTPGRADNNLATVDRQTIRALLEAAWAGAKPS